MNKPRFFSLTNRLGSVLRPDTLQSLAKFIQDKTRQHLLEKEGDSSVRTLRKSFLLTIKVKQKSCYKALKAYKTLFQMI